MEMVAIVFRYGLAWLGGAWFGYPTLASCKTAFYFLARPGKARQGAARHGQAWLQLSEDAGQSPHNFTFGVAWRGQAGHGSARRGKATTWTRTRQKSETLFTFGTDGPGAAWRGSARQGKANTSRHLRVAGQPFFTFGKAWHGVARHGEARRGLAWLTSTDRT